MSKKNETVPFDEWTPSPMPMDGYETIWHPLTGHRVYYRHDELGYGPPIGKFRKYYDAVDFANMKNKELDERRNAKLSS